MINYLKKYAIFLLLFFSAVILAMSLRGHIGNPKAAELREPYWTTNGPFELSPERGRFALGYSLVYDKSVFFSTDLARFTTPDLGYKNGRYVSLFAPGVSYIIAIGIYLGSLVGASQLGAYAIVAMFAILNTYLIYRLLLRISISRTAALLASFTFLFATPAFAYGVNLYQHHFSTALILLSLNLLFSPQSWWTVFFVWILCASSVPIDYPNALLMVPIGVALLSSLFKMVKTKVTFNFTVDPKLLTAIVGVIFPMIFFFYFNNSSYGNPLQLAGTVASIARIDDQGNPAPPERDYAMLGEEYVNPDQQKKSAVGFFEPRDLINGFYTHTMSRDRSLLFFTPILVLALLGIYPLFKLSSQLGVLSISITTIALLVYSLWGDPWGGWAFGSRYLIPAYAMLAFPLAAFYDKFRSNVLMITTAIVLTLYSLFVNTTGALGTMAIPPKVQVLALEAVTGRVEHYSWDRSWEYIKGGNIKSAFYETLLTETFDPITYFYIIFGMLSVSYLGLTLVLLVTGRRSK